MGRSVLRPMYTNLSQYPVVNLDFVLSSEAKATA